MISDWKNYCWWEESFICERCGIFSEAYTVVVVIKPKQTKPVLSALMLTKWPRQPSDCEFVIKEEDATDYPIQPMSRAKKLLGCDVKGDSCQNFKPNNRRPPVPVLHNFLLVNLLYLFCGKMHVFDVDVVISNDRSETFVGPLHLF